mgnify:CR=1 FL=1
MNQEPRIGGSRFPKLIIRYFLMFSILAALLAVFLNLGFNYVFDDGMTYRLSEYAISRNEDTVREYLLTYRGEADGHNDAIIFLDWGIKHQKDFVKIVEGVGSAQKAHLCERIGFAATDSGQDDDFEAAFRYDESECLTTIRSEIESNRIFEQKSTLENR